MASLEREGGGGGGEEEGERDIEREGGRKEGVRKEIGVVRK